MLNYINEELISGSDVLGHVQNELNGLYKTLGGDKSGISLTPLPRHMRDLNRGIDVKLCD